MDRLRYSENKQYLTLSNAIYDVNDLDDIDRVCDILFLRDVFCPLTQVMIRGVYHGKHDGRENWLIIISEGFHNAWLGIRCDELKGAASRGFNHKQKYCCNARTKISSEFYQRADHSKFLNGFGIRSIKN